MPASSEKQSKRIFQTLHNHNYVSHLEGVNRWQANLMQTNVELKNYLCK